jgi:glycosyltransferase involved in cell wall biosynthesis
VVSISIILPTAREDYSIIGLPDLHILERTFNSLLNQRFKDFEVIVVDGLYPKRDKWLAKDWKFSVRYVPVHRNHRFWFDRKRWFICASLNTGIIHAEGELLVRIDDCCEFDDMFLQRFWDGYKKGYFPCAMHIRYLEGKPARFDSEYMNKGYEAKYSSTMEKDDRLQILRRLYGDEGLVRDTRYPVVKANGGNMIGPAEWFYGYASMSLEAALKINGFNELFDGDKSEEDMECGLRLSMAGYKNMFLLDVDHQVIEHEHIPPSSELILPDQPNIKCNYALLLLTEKRNRWQANKVKMTEEDLNFLREESLKSPCSPRPNFYADDCKGYLWNLWASNQNIFDLREERILS